MRASTEVGIMKRTTRRRRSVCQILVTLRRSTGVWESGRRPIRASTWVASSRSMCVSQWSVSP